MTKKKYTTDQAPRCEHMFFFLLEDSPSAYELPMNSGLRLGRPPHESFGWLELSASVVVP